MLIRCRLNKATLQLASCINNSCSSINTYYNYNRDGITSINKLIRSRMRAQATRVPQGKLDMSGASDSLRHLNPINLLTQVIHQTTQTPIITTVTKRKREEKILIDNTYLG